MEAPRISRIRIYPVKALDPIEVSAAEVGLHSLKYDREFAMLAEDGRFINGKRTGLVNQLKASFDLEKGLISLVPRKGGESQTFELRAGNPELEAWLEAYFQLKLKVLHSTSGKLQDMPLVGSLTVVSEATMLSLQESFPDHSLEDLRLRFRTNIEITGVDAYWEDHLFGPEDIGIRFKCGEVEMVGLSPRARCSVPPRDPLTGVVDNSFAKIMMKSRADNLPDFSHLPEYPNYYYLTVNTFLPASEAGKTLRVGDPVEIVEQVNISEMRELS